MADSSNPALGTLTGGFQELIKEEEPSNWDKFWDYMDYPSILHDGWTNAVAPLPGWVIWYLLNLVFDVPFMGWWIGALIVIGLIYLDNFVFIGEDSVQTLWCRAFTNAAMALAAILIIGLTPLAIGPPKPTGPLTTFISYFALLWFAAAGRLIIIIPRIYQRGLSDGPDILQAFLK